MAESSGGDIARYWDEHRESIRDPAYWMAHPVCRRAINRRVTGDENEWPFDWFRRLFAPVPFPRGVSWGCGLGAFERAAIRMGVVRSIDAFDISPASLADARREAAREGISSIQFSIGDFDAPRLSRRRYDIAFFHSSLHHVRRLERLFAALDRALKPGGAVYVDEYVGPSRGRWTYAALRRAQELLDSLPRRARTVPVLRPPIHATDASEAARSDEIPAFLRRHFDLAAWRPYGGQLAGLVVPALDPEWAASEEGSRAIERMMALEDEELDRSPEATHHLVACGTRKAAPASPGILSRLFSARRP